MFVPQTFRLNNISIRLQGEAVVDWVSRAIPLQGANAIRIEAIVVENSSGTGSIDFCTDRSSDGQNWTAGLQEDLFGPLEVYTYSALTCGFVRFRANVPDIASGSAEFSLVVHTAQL